MRTFEAYAGMAEEALRARFPERADEGLVVGEIAPLLYRAMRYSLLSGGKRVRAALMLAVADMLSGDAESALPFAMAVEMIHASSLIHDDMPCMDDDVLRRGKPTNHVVFGEGQALLAGDGLLNMAYEIMLSHIESLGERAANAVRAASEIARGAGVKGMMAGQCIDMLAESAHTKGHGEALDFIQANKTAAMFKYPMRAMGRLCGAPTKTCMDLGEYGMKLGLLFQTTDDILDEEGGEELGKSLHKDAEGSKLTAVSFYGLDGAKKNAANLARELREIATRLRGGEGFFTEFADRMANRRK